MIAGQLCGILITLSRKPACVRDVSEPDAGTNDRRECSGNAALVHILDTFGNTFVGKIPDFIVRQELHVSRRREMVMDVDPAVGGRRSEPLAEYIPDLDANYEIGETNERILRAMSAALQAGQKGDQKRIAMPADAIRDGADFIVVGRAITDSSDPRAAAERILEEISGQ